MWKGIWRQATPGLCPKPSTPNYANTAGCASRPRGPCKEKSGVQSRRLLQGALDQSQAALGLFAQRPVESFALVSQGMQLIGNGERRKNGHLQRIHGVRGFGDVAHLVVHVAGEFLHVGFFEIAADEVALVVDLHSDGLAHGSLRRLDSLEHNTEVTESTENTENARQPARSFAPSRFSSAATMRAEKSVNCDSASVDSWLWKVTRTSREYFPAGTCPPRNRSTASIEAASAMLSERMASETCAKVAPSARSIEKSRSTAGKPDNCSQRSAMRADSFAA